MQCYCKHPNCIHPIHQSFLITSTHTRGTQQKTLLHSPPCIYQLWCHGQLYTPPSLTKTFHHHHTLRNPTPATHSYGKGILLSYPSGQHNTGHTTQAH